MRHEIDDHDEDGRHREVHRQIGCRAREIKGAQPIHATRPLLQQHLVFLHACHVRLLVIQLPKCKFTIHFTLKSYSSLYFVPFGLVQSAVSDWAHCACKSLHEMHTRLHCCMHA